MTEQGVLYVVATPIGNLEDMTVRAMETLGKSDLIACEDTRKSRILLQRWKISTRLMSVHRFSEARKIRSVLERLAQGENVSIISDAGTPAVSDPGSRLVKAVMEAGFRVVPIPGPSSIVAALSVSGMDCSSFIYLGFAPRTEKQRSEFFENLRTEARTAVFFDTARRIRDTLRAATDPLGQRRLVVLRELTKLHEESLFGSVTEVLESLERKDTIKGEFTLVVEGAQAPAETDPHNAVESLIMEGLSGKRLADEAYRRYGIRKSVAYQIYLEMKRPEEH
jgi:16S rRNA (cytidine1402-2'-O)-methyltransferase